MELIPVREERDTLQGVFGVVQKAGGKLAVERERASQWLEHARREIEQATQAEIA